MGLIEIDGKLALALLAEAVEAKGAEYVYPRADYDGCSYVRDGECSCLVGEALYRAGVPIGALVRMDSQGDSAISAIRDDDEGGSTEDFGFTLTDSASRAFSTAQNSQDFGKTWGYALDRARAAVGV